MDTYMKTAEQIELQVKMLNKMQDSFSDSVTGLREYQRKQHMESLKQMERRVGEGIQQQQEYDEQYNEIQKQKNEMKPTKDETDL